MNAFWSAVGACVIVLCAYDIAWHRARREPELPCGHAGLPTDNYCGHCGRHNDGVEEAK